jgi:secreted Zn-dependent insulinase-like peptidase
MLAPTVVQLRFARWLLPSTRSRIKCPALSFAVCLQHRGVLMRVVPIKESHTLEVTWDIPPTEALYRKAPTNYLSHLLGHEGAGSAFALLKARGLAIALSAGDSRRFGGGEKYGIFAAVCVGVGGG